jgi:hypothetical protein
MCDINTLLVNGVWFMKYLWGVLLALAVIFMGAGIYYMLVLA